MKKLAILLVAALFALSIVSCAGGTSAGSSSAAKTTAAEDSTKKESASEKSSVKASDEKEPATAKNDAKDKGEMPSIKEARGVTIPQFTLMINDKEITDKDMADAAVYEISTTTVNSSGTESSNVYVGFALSDVLKTAGADTFKTLTASADDGYSVDISFDDATAPTTLVALTQDGKQFKTGPWLAPCASGTTGDYLKDMTSILLDGAKTEKKDDASAESKDGTKSSEKGSDAKADEKGDLPEILDKTDKVQFADYSFKVNGKDVTNETLKGLSIYKIDVTTTNSKGETSDSTYTGYKLADVLKACGVDAPKKVSAVANDGFTAELSAENIESDYTLVAIEKDKEVGKDGTIWLAPCMSASSGDYCKLVVEIKAE